MLFLVELEAGTALELGSASQDAQPRAGVGEELEASLSLVLSELAEQFLLDQVLGLGHLAGVLFLGDESEGLLLLEVALVRELGAFGVLGRRFLGHLDGHDLTLGRQDQLGDLFYLLLVLLEYNVLFPDDFIWRLQHFLWIDPLISHFSLQLLHILLELILLLVLLFAFSAAGGLCYPELGFQVLLTLGLLRQVGKH